MRKELHLHLLSACFSRTDHFKHAQLPERYGSVLLFSGGKDIGIGRRMIRRQLIPGLTILIPRFAPASGMLPQMY